MKQITVLGSAAEILGLQETSFSMLRRCANLVLSNIAVSSRDFVTRQTFNVKDGKIEYRDFEKTFLRIKNVYVNSTEVTYSLFIDFLQVPNGRAEVDYCYVPAFTDDLMQEIIIPNLSEQTFIYGVITEYALISGMLNEAKIWNEKFETGLFSVSEKNKNINLTAPRW